MAQGAVKKSSAAPKPKLAHSKKQASRVSKAGNKTANYTKGKVSADKVHRRFTAGMAAKTEALLGERAGHLELIGKGKKGRKAGGAEAKKGGSKKFG